MGAERALQSYFSVSAAALMLFDYSITLQREVDLMWPTRWSLVKFLFFFTRYSPFIDLPLDLYVQLATNATGRTCLVTYLSSRWILALGISGSEVILLIRTWVIWDKRKSILITVLSMGVFAVVSMLLPFVVWTRSLLLQSAQPVRSRCEFRTGSSVIGLSLIGVIFLETIVMVLTAVRMVQQLRDSGKHILQISICRVLYRDGLLFFGYLLAISTINFIFILFGPPVSRDLLVVVQRVLHSSLTSRILLNLREAGQGDGHSLAGKSRLLEATV